MSRKGKIFWAVAAALAVSPATQAEFILHRPPPPPSQTVAAVFEAVTAEDEASAGETASAEPTVAAVAPATPQVDAHAVPMIEAPQESVPEPAPVVEAAPAVEVYRIEAGESLREAYARWCEAAGWSLVWRARFTFVAEAGHAFAGPLPVAAERALRGFEPRDGKRLTARAYTGNRVLVVDAVGGGSL